jgi:hypothetical protein
MGHSYYSHAGYLATSRSLAGKSTDDIFTQNEKRAVSADMSPFGLKVRECRDSVEHPETLPVGIFLDVTGSMGRIPDALVRGPLGTLMTTLLNNQLPDVQILMGFIGDHVSDSAPLQVGQFESGDIELVKWLTQGYLEGNGGGQRMESYLLAWLIGARHTALDSMEKRNKKGLLFTIGDEASWSEVSGTHLKKMMGYDSGEHMSDKQLLEEARKKYDVFHMHINEGSYKDNAEILGYWEKLLGMPAIIVHDYTKLAEIIAVAVANLQGIAPKTLTKQFDKTTARHIDRSLEHVYAYSASK